MSMLVEIAQTPRMHNGQIVKVGRCVKLPNSMALAMLKNGHAVKPAPGEHKKSGERRSKAKADSKAARAQKKKGRG